MGRWNRDSNTVWRALVVQEFGDDDVDVFEYIRRTSRADDGADPT